MEDYNAQGQQQKIVPVVMVTHHPVDEDVINFSGLLRVMLRWRWVVFGVVFLAILGSVTYALLATPIYKAEAILLPPLDSDLDGLNVKTTTAYQLFDDNLSSLSLRRKFFDKYDVIKQLVPNPKSIHDVESVFQHGFNSALSVRHQKKGDVIRVSFEGPNARLAAQWVNQFVEAAGNETVHELVGDAESKIQSRLDYLNNHIVAKRKIAKEVLGDRISRLESAARIAEQLGIKDIMPGGMAVAVVGTQPQTGSGSGAESGAGSGLGDGTLDGTLYMRGYRALHAEANALRQRQRQDSDAFIPGIRDLQERVELLKNMHPDPSHISVMRIDQPALVPILRTKPERKRIVLIGLLGGLAIGMFVAYLVDFIVRMRRGVS